MSSAPTETTAAMPPTSMQSFMRVVTRLTVLSLMRVHISGQENVPSRGPLVAVANHLSTVDAMLAAMVLPPHTWYVGPGDFKLLFPANLVLRWNRTILVRRSTRMEIASLKRMTDVLKAGGILFLFPEGGTWEKPISDAKGGAAYLSMAANAPILPIALGNTYQVWDKALRLERPRLTVNIGRIMPPVQAERARRSEALEAATREMMRRIYDMLPVQEKAWYDEQARRRFDLFVDVWRGDVCSTANLPGREALAELMLKPNMLSPLWRNAGLPIDPLRMHGVRYPAAAIRLATNSLLSALAGSFSDYLEYRLGDTKAAAIRGALAMLQHLASGSSITGIVLKPTSVIESVQT